MPTANGKVWYGRTTLEIGAQEWSAWASQASAQQEKKPFDAASARPLTTQGRQVLASCLRSWKLLPACICLHASMLFQKLRNYGAEGQTYLVTRTVQQPVFSFVQLIGHHIAGLQLGRNSQHLGSERTTELESKRCKERAFRSLLLRLSSATSSTPWK